MKYLSPIPILLLLSSCSKNTIYVWNMKDVIGFWIAGAVVLIIGILYLYAVIADKFNNWRKRKK